MTACCRACGSADLYPVLSLGSTPLANGLLTSQQLDQDEPRFALDVVFCRQCSLVQIKDVVPPAALFSDYLYFSSFSDTMMSHARTLALELMEREKLGPDSLVMEIASNDGYLLRNYHESGIPVLGIEPAANIAKVARERHGIEVVCDFFGLELGQTLAAQGRLADVVHAHNVMAHVPDINGFLRGLAAVLKPGGCAVIEFPYLRDLVEGLEFDTIYHEHVFYLSLLPLLTLAERCGLAVEDCQRVPIHGGSLRLVLRHRAHARPTAAVAVLEREEKQLGLDGSAYYARFSGQVHALTGQLRELLLRLKGQGASIAAYGASAKGSTLLNFSGIGADILDFVADRSTVKQGRFTPGTHLPILAPEALEQRMPDYVLLLTWNFADEILEQQSGYRAKGGKFIIPLPDVRIV